MGWDQPVIETSRLLIGWREWIALPELHLPAIKAKVDTGARTSALHAFEVEAFHERGVLKVRFRVHPMQRRSDIVISCVAPVIDYRTVSDSGGHHEKRFVIETTLSIGSLKFPIEMTLANRETMSHRMLLGRSAMKNLIIDPAHSYHLGRPEKIKSLYSKSAVKRKKVKSLKSRSPEKKLAKIPERKPE
jgi:hypothetical protein